jgi:hypothetical protein
VCHKNSLKSVKSSHTFDSVAMFTAYKKKVIRIVMGLGKRDSCRAAFRELKILPLSSEYIYSLMKYVLSNRHQFLWNYEIHSIGTRQNNNLFPPSVSLTNVQKGAYYSGIKIFNNLPVKLKELSNDLKSFEVALKRFLLDGSYYSLNEYFENKHF